MLNKDELGIKMGVIWVTTWVIEKLLILKANNSYRYWGKYDSPASTLDRFRKYDIIIFFPVVRIKSWLIGNRL